MDNSEELKARQEELTKIRRLLDLDGFQWLENICNQQLQARLAELVLSPPTGVDDMVKRAYTLGECAGMRLVLGLPHVQREVISQEIKAAGERNDE